MKRSSTCGSGATTTRAWSTVNVSSPGTATSRASLRSTPMGPPSQLSRRAEAASARSIPPTVKAWTRRFVSWVQATGSSRPAKDARSTFSTPGASSTSAVTSRPVSAWRLTSVASAACSPSTATSKDWRMVEKTKSKRASGVFPAGSRGARSRLAE